ncbi:MAG TPA: M20 family metallopeptidase [Saprospiraceae bacterium]|nr:amidohydrolase [Saprospiraceae bacterium]HMX82065.1 M20 family metallopeptidase [Saprospiraceae bacterium]HMX85046.1 M20 family metallopeptidase [Saprospiraceae bacterium]HMZ72140.1 M20 family metallopeptidase [Saprospiraceae bacterium]HNA41831.1 M20 family metallopeptidase [Saprospiraceae bacterium]
MANELHLKELIREKAAGLLPDIIKIRRHLHAHPELSFEEFKTSEYIRNILTGQQIKFTEQWVRTGIVAEVGNTENYVQTIALRADIDALPIQETNDVPYKSVNAGVMHACGHDVHTSCLIGALIILNSLEVKWKNRTIGIFQPGEEKLPGGASLMIGEGLIDNYKPEAIFGLHVLPQMEASNVGICPGKSMASSDEIYITIQGIGGHAAMPHLAIDPILIAADVLSGIQKVVSRHANPMIPTVLSFGKINSIGGATNVIPDEVKIEGTFRTMDENWRREAHQIMRTYIQNTAEASGGKADVDIRKGYPCLINDDRLYAYGQQKLMELLDKNHVLDVPARMTSEDFAYYSQQIPSLFFRLGTGNRLKKITSPVHTSSFDADESALETGMAAMAYLAACKMME